LKPRLLIDSDVLEFLKSLRKRDRELLLRRFEAIRDYPARHRDFQTKDETGRDVDGHVVDRFSIVFWDDSADRHVKILSLGWADKVK
jgi:hypothetical protein